ncbi:hypothetical protein AG0111_0g9460 [Alternaria gaisen]|uniref:Uncharacterized protein n=1 Tax=Alternaria gaisen TaxID=167740 RepID=A0ACB6FBJ7_9PLEO|nr:hypothetical protein AG0111_0g9460 [Alternaria gaisen]
MDMSALFQSVAGGLPMPSAFLEPAGVRREARDLATKLFEDHDTLKRTIERHEETIRKRWNKKTNAQRKQILLEAWPVMSAQHRPDIAAWRQHSRTKEAYMWPYINLEDLVKRTPLLLLLHYRGRHQPYEFVHSDLKQARLGEVSGITMPGFLNEYTMLFVDRTAPETYGELVSWNDDDAAFENMSNGVGMHPGHGLQALEIQQRIWAFLVKCCRILLQDFISTVESEVFPNPGPPATQDENAMLLEVVSLEAPYRLPAHLDFDRLKAMASAERNSREDHLWSMREDPGYFAEAMQELSEHRQEMLLDTRGKPHPTLKEAGRPLFWNRVLGSAVVAAYFGFATFDEVVKQVEKVASTYEACKESLNGEEDLPTDLFDAFQNLRFLLDAAKTDLVLNLKVGLFASPPIRQFCVREPQQPNTSKIRSMFQPPRSDHAVNRLMPLFNILFNDEQLFLFGLHTITDEIGRLIRTDPAVATLISPYIAGRISSLSVVSECLHQLHLFQPWARKIEDGMELKKDELSRQYYQTFKGWANIMGINNFEGSQVYKYADPTDGKFDYPAHRRRNKQNVEIMRKAEASLDAFWEAVDRQYKSRSAGSQHDKVTHLLSKDRAVQRTPPWEEPDKTKNSASVAPVEYVYQPFSSVYHDATKQITGVFDRATLDEPAVKPKTRGNAPQPVEPTAPATATQDKQLQPIFTVDKRAHKVFKSLFHLPYNTNLPGEVPWSDFLHAMVLIGFSAEKMHGSAWNFTPNTIDAGVERSIQFHEPHPSNKLPMLLARRYGRRLARNFGWSGDMFRLA